MSSQDTGWPPLDFYNAWQRWLQSMPRSEGDDPRSGTLSVVPQMLTQPINPGWIFGNVSITNENSNDPEAERRILAVVSYGRQLGRIMDAMAVLIARTEGTELTAKEKQAFDGFREMETKIDEAKNEAGSRWISEKGISELADRLKKLETSDRETYERLIAILRSTLDI